MCRVFFTSDLHLGHNREFIYEARGFKTIEDHDQRALENWNRVVRPEDEIYFLGDLMLCDVENGLNILGRLNGKIHIIRGNHDTNEKIRRYKECENVMEIEAAAYLKKGKFTFYLSHYPTLVTSKMPERAEEALINLYGHTHQKTNFYENGEKINPCMYHVGVDSHDMCPIELEQVIEEVRKQKGGINYVC